MRLRSRFPILAALILTAGLAPDRAAAAPASEDRMERRLAEAAITARIEAVNRGAIIVPYTHRGRRIPVMISREEFNEALTLAVFAGDIAPEDIPEIVRTAGAYSNRQLARLHEARDTYREPGERYGAAAAPGYARGPAPAGYGGGGPSAGYPDEDPLVIGQGGRPRRVRDAAPPGAGDPASRQRHRRERPPRAERHRPPT